MLGLSTNDILFWILSLGIVFFAWSVFSHRNPISAALSLVMTMIGLAGVFYNLGAHFLAGVQMIVYAGAVMVLFVMVLMLFDLKHEDRAFVRGAISGGMKFLASGWLLFVIVASAVFSEEMLTNAAIDQKTEVEMSTKELATLLYTDYIVAFEVLGVVLLVVAIGAVALSRIKGGTHAAPE